MDATMTKEEMLHKAMGVLPHRGSGLTEAEITRLTEFPVGVLVNLLTYTRQSTVNHRKRGVEFDDNRMKHWMRQNVEGVEKALLRVGIDPADIPWPKREMMKPRIVQQYENKEQNTKTTVVQTEVEWKSGSTVGGANVLHALIPTPAGDVLPARQRMVTHGSGMFRKTTTYTSVNGGPETTSIETGKSLFRVEITWSTKDWKDVTYRATP